MATSLINTECKRYGCMKNLLACYANCKYNSRCEELRTEIMPIVTQAANDINSYRQERGLSAIEIQMTKRGLKFLDVMSLQKKSPQSKNRINQSTRLIKAKPQTKANPEIKTTARPTEETIALNVRSFKSGVLNKKSISKRKIKKSLAKVKKLVENKPLRFTSPPKATEIKATQSLPEKPRQKIRKRRKTPTRKINLKMETQAKMPRRAKELETGLVSENQENFTGGGGNANQLTATHTTEKTGSQGKRRSAKDLAAKKKKKMFIILDGNNSALVDERGLMAKLLAGVSPNARYFEATEIELRLQIGYKK